MPAAPLRAPHREGVFATAVPRQGRPFSSERPPFFIGATDSASGSLWRPPAIHRVFVLAPPHRLSSRSNPGRSGSLAACRSSSVRLTPPNPPPPAAAAPAAATLSSCSAPPGARRQVRAAAGPAPPPEPPAARRGVALSGLTISVHSGAAERRPTRAEPDRARPGRADSAHPFTGPSASSTGGILGVTQVPHAPPRIEMVNCGMAGSPERSPVGNPWLKICSKIWSNLV